MNLGVALVVVAGALVLAALARRHRAAAVALALGLVGIVAAPVARPPTHDGFPLSTYPMFAQPRRTLQSLDYAFGETATGERRALRPRLVGSGEVLQAMSVINRARATRTLPALCKAIAARVAADARYADVARIRIVTGTHDAVEYLVRGKRGAEVERARCEVTR